MFEKEVGTAPREYLVQTRLRNVMQILTHGNASLEESSEQCGGSTANHFIRSVKAHTSFTPGPFRKHFNDVPSGELIDN